MIGWHHRLDGHEFEQSPGICDRQGSLVCCSPWGCKESDTTERLNFNCIVILPVATSLKLGAQLWNKVLKNFIFIFHRYLYSHRYIRTTGNYKVHLKTQIQHSMQLTGFKVFLIFNASFSEQMLTKKMMIYMNANLELLVSVGIILL